MITLAGKMILLYLCIGLVLATAGVPNAFTDALTDGEGGLSGNVTNTLPDVNEQTGSVSGVLSFIDALRALRNFILFFGTVLVALPAVLFDLAIPEIVRIIIAVPLSILGVIALAQFGRSGN